MSCSLISCLRFWIDPKPIYETCLSVTGKGFVLRKKSHEWMKKWINVYKLEFQTFFLYYFVLNVIVQNDPNWNFFLFFNIIVFYFKTHSMWHPLSDNIQYISQSQALSSLPSSVRDTSPLVASMLNMWLAGMRGIWSRRRKRRSAWGVFRSSRSKAPTCMNGIAGFWEETTRNETQLLHLAQFCLLFKKSVFILYNS